MSIRQISLNNFRNLSSTTLDLHQSLNIVTGSNASGKTNFLELVHIICQGQSFRTYKIDQCIQSGEKSFLLFALFDNYKAGISRNGKKTNIRINNETIHKLSYLAEKTPVRIINESSFNLILGSPNEKREFIDWCLFHVEHNYQSLWLDHKHALKQRNALLKQKKNLSELDYWDKYFADICNKIYSLRFKYIKILIEILNLEFSELIKEMPINISYEPGWNTNDSLIEILKKQRDKDIKFGYTRYGSHRDDVKITVNDDPVQTIFSRGQIKKISIALLLTQILFLIQKSDKKVILLIDDIDSELDQDSVDYILGKLKINQLQIFISNIKASNRLMKYHEEYKLFHVEHGMIKAVKNL